jgi:hypothetical protein
MNTETLINAAQKVGSVALVSFLLVMAIAFAA